MKDSRAFSLNCTFCLELLPCQLNWAIQLLSAQPSNCCLVRATYWATVALEHLMRSQSRLKVFSSPHLNECCMTRCPWTQWLPEGMWLFCVTLRGSYCVDCWEFTWFPRRGRDISRRADPAISGFLQVLVRCPEVSAEMPSAKGGLINVCPGRMLPLVQIIWI